MKTKIALLSCLLMVLNTAHADEKGKSHSEVTDSHGTEVVTDSSQKEGTTITGAKKSETDVEVSKDPKGLMNKTKEEAHLETKVQKDGDSSLEAHSRDAAGTAKKVTVDTDVDKNSDGSVTTTIDRKEVVDPKGLMNKTTTKTEEKITRNADGTVSKSVVKDVNGNKVEESHSGRH